MVTDLTFRNVIVSDSWYYMVCIILDYNDFTILIEIVVDKGGMEL